MGVYTFTAPCFGCKKPFTFHPNKVPVIIVDGVRHPICRDCVDLVNPLREAKGLPLITYTEDAYKPALDDEEDRIDWGPD